MLTFWPSITQGFPTVRSRVTFIQTEKKQLSNTCEMFVASLTRRFVSVKRLFTDLQKSLGRDERPRQTSHEHLNGKNMTQQKMGVENVEKASGKRGRFLVTGEQVV